MGASRAPNFGRAEGWGQELPGGGVWCPQPRAGLVYLGRCGEVEGGPVP